MKVYITYKFKDADLIGIPLRVTLGEKNVKKGLLEIRKRKTGETLLVKKEDAVSKIKEIIDGKETDQAKSKM
jgi:prolyl-tRNA synthetase